MAILPCHLIHFEHDENPAHPAFSHSFGTGRLETFLFHSVSRYLKLFHINCLYEKESTPKRIKRLLRRLLWGPFLVPGVVLDDTLDQQLALVRVLRHLLYRSRTDYPEHPAIAQVERRVVTVMIRHDNAVVDTDVSGSMSADRFLDRAEQLVEKFRVSPCFIQAVVGQDKYRLVCQLIHLPSNCPTRRWATSRKRDRRTDR